MMATFSQLVFTHIYLLYNRLSRLWRWGVVSINNGKPYCIFTDDVDSVVPPEPDETVIIDRIDLVPESGLTGNDSLAILT